MLHYLHLRLKTTTMMTPLQGLICLQIRVLPTPTYLLFNPDNWTILSIYRMMIWYLQAPTSSLVLMRSCHIENHDQNKYHHLLQRVAQVAQYVRETLRQSKPPRIVGRLRNKRKGTANRRRLIQLNLMNLSYQFVALNRFVTRLELEQIPTLYLSRIKLFLFPCVDTIDGN